MPSYSEFQFNVDHGYLEGLVRGFKGGILKATDYVNLAQCETLEGALVCSKIEPMTFESVVIWLLLCFDGEGKKSEMTLTFD